MAHPILLVIAAVSALLLGMALSTGEIVGRRNRRRIRRASEPNLYWTNVGLLAAVTLALVGWAIF